MILQSLLCGTGVLPSVSMVLQILLHGWSAVFILRDPQPCIPFLSILAYSKTDTILLVSPHKLLTLDIHSVLCCPQVENSPKCAMAGERASGVRSGQCHEFSYCAFMLLVSSLPGVQEPFNCFLNFSQRYLICLLLLSLLR